jgi:hypothetical protein
VRDVCWTATSRDRSLDARAYVLGLISMVADQEGSGLASLSMPEILKEFAWETSARDSLAQGRLNFCSIRRSKGGAVFETSCQFPSGLVASLLASH